MPLAADGDHLCRANCFPEFHHFMPAITERRALIVLLLLAAAGAFYIWGWPLVKGKESPTPEKTEAEERAKADPFPATGK
jgi:hypothetical protein